MNELSLFRCLAEPTRLAILRHLTATEERTAGELAGFVKQERTNVSHHLAQLRACGLVRTRAEGPRIHYALGHAHLQELLELAAETAEHIGKGDEQACLTEGCC